MLYKKTNKKYNKAKLEANTNLMVSEAFFNFIQLTFCKANSC